MQSLALFLVGILVGGVIMFFVYRKNTKAFRDKEQELIELVERMKKAAKQ